MNEHHHHHEEKETSKYEQALSLYNINIDDATVNKEVEKIIGEKVVENHTPEVIKFLLGCVELTSLKPTDNEDSILKLTEKVNSLEATYPDVPHPASICVYPNYAQIVNNSLEVEGVEVACVSGGFPSAQTFIEVKMAETSLAINDGATEIDTVMSVGHFFNEDYETLCDEIEEIKAACGTHKLKVILETGILHTAANIKKASLLCMYSGADFIKTSTGKELPATPQAAYVMCHAIKEYYDKTGIRIGFKAAGGLNTIADALTYYTIVKEVLGKEWLTNNLFRIGTSRLENLLLSELKGKEVQFF